jgi:hypothetical protein
VPYGVSFESILDVPSERLEGRFETERIFESTIRYRIGLTYYNLSNYEAAVSNLSNHYQYEVGINIGSYDASFYDLGLVSAFDNIDDFWAYTKYQEHDEVLEFIQSIQLDEQIVDYQL